MTRSNLAAAIQGDREGGSSRRGALLRVSVGAILLSALTWLVALPALAQAERDLSDAEIVSSHVAALFEIVDTPDVDPEAAVVALEAMVADGSLHLADREHAFYEFAMEQRDEAETVVGRRALEWLSGYESLVRVPLEDRGPAIVQAWRVAGVARGTLTMWDRAEPEANVAAAMARATLTGDVAALTQTLETAPEAEAAAHRAELLAMLERSDAHAPSVAAAALRLQDAALIEAVLAAEDRRTAVRLVADIGETLPPEQAFPILRDACLQDDLASAALFAIASTAPDLAEARDFLFESLGDPRLGGSAAAALAAMHDDAIVVAVGDALETSQNETFQNKAVLALVLSDSPLAQTSLREFARRDDVPEKLRRELDIWLWEAQ